MGKKYMVKFPDPIHAKFMPYVNNQYSEYIGCKIFELLKVPVQNVELVKCKVNGKEKVAVMCEGFLKPGEKLREFKNVFLSLNMEKKFTSNIDDILK